MRFTTPYHYNLINDTIRLFAFYNAINDYISLFDSETAENFNVLDLGCGSGVLSSFIAPYVNNVVAIDIDSKIADCASKNRDYYNIDNVEVINADASIYNFNEIKADLIICEMIDTGLIDEEEVQVLNNVINSKFCNKSNLTVIPKAIINIVEAVNMNINNIAYDEDNINITTISNTITLNTVEFSSKINKNVDINFNLNAIKSGTVNGIKLTTVTVLNDNLVCGPSPMFNPPLIIPINNDNTNVNDNNNKNDNGNDIGVKVTKGDNLSFNISYVMGEGLETVSLSYCGIT